MKQRVQTLNTAIFKTQQPLFRLRKLLDSKSGEDSFCAYVATLRKCPDCSIEQRIDEFHNCLLSQLTSGESLDYAEQCFSIKGDGYTITYCLEAYKNSANQLGFICDGKPAVKILHRMGCEAAFRWMRRNCSNQECDNIFARMRFREMMSAYPNPSDRFVKCVNITKAERKELSKVLAGRCASDHRKSRYVSI